MLGIHYVCVSECQSEDPLVCFGAKSPTRLEEDEGRKVPEQDRTEKWTEQGSWRKLGEADSKEKRDNC